MHRSAHPLLALIIAFVTAAANAFAQIPGVTMPPADGKLRIIAFGAHPDDSELQVGGVGALWARQGHHVLLVSVTNGDIGHWREAGGPLAVRRKKEVAAAHAILGVQGVVLDNSDDRLVEQPAIILIAVLGSTADGAGKKMALG